VNVYPTWKSSVTLCTCSRHQYVWEFWKNSFETPNNLTCSCHDLLIEDVGNLAGSSDSGGPSCVLFGAAWNAAVCGGIWSKDTKCLCMKYRWERKLYAVTQLGYFTQMSSADWGRQHVHTCSNLKPISFYTTICSWELPRILNKSASWFLVALSDSNFHSRTTVISTCCLIIS
jgi:hypothetical protein